MSWLVSSIANSLKLDDDDDVTTTTSAATTATENPNYSENQQINNPNTSPPPSQPPPPSDHHSTTPRGVKDDLSEFSKTLTRQFWGVASFLAPPPQISDHDRDQVHDQDPQHRDGESFDDRDRDESDLVRITGIRNDLSEIGGKFRTGISKLSSNKAVTEFTKIASNLLQFGTDEDLSIEEYTRRGVVGVTEEVVAFARDVSMHPETWIDFPLPDDEDDDDGGDFDLSDAQQEHALAVERLAPELAALRTELCLGYMNEGSFWKIYFVLVHPRLSRQAAEILSTPQIVRARQMLTQELHSRHQLKPHDSKSNKSSAGITNLSHEEHLSVPVAERPEDIPVEISSVEPVPSAGADLEVDKHAVSTTEIPVIDKAVVDEVPKKLMGSFNTNSNDGDGKVVDKEVSNKQMQKAIPDSSGSIDHKEDDDVDDWLKEESAEDGSYKVTSYQIENDDDVSFSDLEEDDDVPTSYKKAGNPNSSAKESSDWIQLSSRSTDSSKVLDAKSIDRPGSSKVSVHNLENKESNDWLDVEDIDDA